MDLTESIAPRSDQERWVAVPGYEGIYEVFDAGRVRSLDRLDSRGNRIRGRVLSPGATDSGHLRVTLCRGGITTRFFVHRLVMTVFVGPLPDGMETCHNDGDPTNNSVGNLRWDTKSANALDRRRHGTDAEARKTHCPRGHVYDEFTYLSREGWRTCRLSWQKDRRAAQKATN